MPLSVTYKQTRFSGLGASNEMGYEITEKTQLRPVQPGEKLTNKYMEGVVAPLISRRSGEKCFGGPRIAELEAMLAASPTGAVELYGDRISTIVFETNELFDAWSAKAPRSVAFVDKR